MRKTKAHLKALVRDRELASVSGNISRLVVIRRHTRSSSEMLSMDSDEETDWSLQQIHSVYESRFLNEFEPVKLLGRSGSYSTFSRVFEAKKRIDGKLYAVKRIKLPAGKESRAKIMKEIMALCDVSNQHRNIVKYFDAWREFPPTGWQDSQDAFQLARLSTSDEEDLMEKPVGQQQQKRHQSQAAATFASIFGGNSSSNHLQSSSSSKAKNQQQHTKLFGINESATADDPLGLATPPEMATKNVDLYLYFRMELCRKESLAEWLITYHQPVPTAKRQDVITMFREILQGVQHLHLKNLIHRNLKPSNIFFSSDGTIKVGNLGLAKDSHQLYVTQQQRSSWTNNEQTKPVDLVSSSSTASAEKESSSCLYTSPEQLESRRYNHKVDVYALAVILFELLVPFTSKAERYRVINELKSTLTFPPTFQKIHPQAETLLIKMLSYNPDHRPEIKTILADAWISGRIRDSSNVTRRPSSVSRMTSTPSMNKAKPRFKILVIGDQNTGKTSIIHRYIRGEFLDPLRQQPVTIGAVVNLKQVTWNEGDSDDVMKREMTLEFCDIGGEERSRFMTSAFYRKAVGAFVVMDVTQPNGFQAATLWKKDLDTKLRMHDDSIVPSVLLINKCDGPTTKYSSSELDPAQVDRYCRQNKFTGWFDTSALNDININEAVQLLLGKILANEASAAASLNKELSSEIANVDDLPRKLGHGSSTAFDANNQAIINSQTKKNNCC